MRPMRPSIPGRDQGFAMIEVLTTMLVISFGLIGLAALGAVGLKNNHMSYFRTIATQQAYDMADRMRANMGDSTGGVKGTTNNYNSISGTGSGDPGCISTGCTYAQLVKYDQYYWNTNNAALLPSGVGTVTGSTSTNFVITVSWTEVCTSSQSGCTSSTQSFSTTFEP
jgi:type IV pilus assembly protein PilV